MPEHVVPDFIVIGAMKAASTTLFGYLSEHPGVFLPEMKELDFFVAEKTWQKGWDWYAELFADAPPGALLGDISPNYTKAGQFDGVAERIREHAPDAKLIYLLRDPVERMRSHYVHRYLAGNDRRPPEQAMVPGSTYVDTTLYGAQLKHYTDLFPAEQILVLLTEDLRDDPAAVLQQTLDFLGLPPHDFADLNRRDHDSAKRRADRGLAARIRRNEKFMLWARQNLPRSLREKVTRRLTDEIDTTQIQVPDSTFVPLRDLLAEDRELLTRLYPLDLHKWAPLDRLTA